MSAAVTGHFILESASSRADGSLGLRFSTPELTPDEMTTIFQLVKRELRVLLQPKDQDPKDLKDIKGEFDRKTPSQRLRGVLFLAWDQQGRPGSFDDFYMKKMEMFINSVKDALK